MLPKPACQWRHFIFGKHACLLIVIIEKDNSFLLKKNNKTDIFVLFFCQKNAHFLDFAKSFRHLAKISVTGVTIRRPGGGTWCVTAKLSVSLSIVFYKAKNVLLIFPVLGWVYFFSIWKPQLTIIIPLHINLKLAVCLQLYVWTMYIPWCQMRICYQLELPYRSFMVHTASSSMILIQVAP